ncbi:hypothetical protein KL920_001130 [Ogataea angusta]|nr:hypothetical protein KL920_001130 [Ogataea angusta]KAG7853687.1 hypothetical protein KL941_000737 [Ogataea angusta]
MGILKRVKLYMRSFDTRLCIQSQEVANILQNDETSAKSAYKVAIKSNGTVLSQMLIVIECTETYNGNHSGPCGSLRRSVNTLMALMLAQITPTKEKTAAQVRCATDVAPDPWPSPY